MALIITLVTLLFKGVLILSDVSSALAWVLVASIFGILIWGFKPRIERAIRGKLHEKEESKLIEIYSPIHAMIIRIYGEVPHSPRDTVGTWVEKSLIDVNIISALFKQHVHELGDNNLKMWLEIEKEIEKRNGFFLTIYRQKWFDALEIEYNRLTKHQPKKQE